MTVAEEIENAMRHGASSMFLFGLMTMFQRDPETTSRAFEQAAKKVLNNREVSLSLDEVRFQKRLARCKDGARGK